MYKYDFKIKQNLTMTKNIVFADRLVVVSTAAGWLSWIFTRISAAAAFFTIKHTACNAIPYKRIRYLD